MTKGISSFGDFTGKCLEMYFNEDVNDALGARRIINGTDCNELIKKYHEKFIDSIKLIENIQSV
jgi:putative chitinase